MVKAYVFINLSARVVKSALVSLRASQITSMADAVTGPYDIVCTIEAESVDELAQIITEEIQTIEGVERTITCIVLDVTRSNN